MDYYKNSTLLTTILFTLMMTSCIPSNQSAPISINEIPTESILNFIDADHFFSQEGLINQYPKNDPSYFVKAQKAVEILYANATIQDEVFPTYIFSWRSGDLLRMDEDLIEALDSRTFKSFWDAPVDEIITTLAFYGLEVRDLTKLYAYDDQTSLRDMQNLALKAVNNIKSGEIPSWSKAQRGQYWNSLTPSEDYFLQTLNLETN